MQCVGALPETYLGEYEGSVPGEDGIQRLTRWAGSRRRCHSKRRLDSLGCDRVEWEKIQD